MTPSFVLTPMGMNGTVNISDCQFTCMKLGLCVQDLQQSEWCYTRFRTKKQKKKHKHLRAENWDVSRRLSLKNKLHEKENKKNKYKGLITLLLNINMFIMWFYFIIFTWILHKIHLLFFSTWLNDPFFTVNIYLWFLNVFKNSSIKIQLIYLSFIFSDARGFIFHPFFFTILVLFNLFDDPC